MLIDQLIIVLVLASLPAVALLAKRGALRATESVSDFVVGDRRFKLFRLGAGISMAFVGGAATLNMASLGYQFGWSVAIDPLVVFISLAIASSLARRVRNGKGITLSDVLGGSSPPLRALLGITGLIVYQMLTASQFVALGRLLGPYFPGVPVAAVILVPTLVVFAYTYLRGFQAVTNTDVLQLIIMLALYAAPCLWVFTTHSAPTPTTAAADSATAPFNLLIYLMLPMLFVPVSHDVNIRIKAAESLFHARAGLMLGAGQYVLFLLISIGVGVYMRKSGHTISVSETTLPLFFHTNFGDWSVIGTIAVLAAIVSTLDSMAFNTIVSASNDVLGPTRAKGILSDTKALALSTSVVLCVSLLIALLFQQILGLVLAALLLYVSVFIPVALGRLLRVRDLALVCTSLLTAAAIIGCKVTGYTPPVEPIAFLGLHVVLVLLAKGMRQ
ncbi:MAG: hypothetical protein IT449_07315 [Phycisphaerales bacterium]|nr:hypothetical protein [Phycisphaerales bacterium]